jgi:phosphoenolpyruvate carboxykinase (GTP)
VRRDPFAMLPFCGYHMGDYFKHWINIEKKTTSEKLPKIFFVNWFRKTDDGKWLWPGYGENSRVLKWIFERCDGSGKAVDTPVGYMPAPDAIDKPASVSNQDMEILLKVDREGWLREVDDVRNNHYPKFGNHLPQELYELLDTMESLLKA